MPKHYSHHTSKEDWSYIAGFLDGEGCFSSSGKYCKIHVTCANTNRPIIEWLHKRFGGVLVVSKQRPNKPHHRRMFTWQLVSNQAADFCRVIAPYLKEKAPQALLLIAIQQTITGKGDRQNISYYLEERRRLAQILKEMKHVAW